MYQTNGRIEGLDVDPSLCSEILLRSCEGEMRVPDSALRCVVYIGVATNKGTFQAKGTGFIVHVVRDDGTYVYYLVTADHVRRALPNDRKFAIRLNDANGVAQLMESPAWPRWWRHPEDDSVDAVAYPWGLREHPFTAFPSERFVTDKNCEQTPTTLGIGIGDEVFIVGLFRKMAGQKRITPIVRSGHIAMMATETISTKNYGDAQFHLVEAFTTAGLSGSPVFVHESAYFRYLPIGSETPAVAMAVGKIHCLGLVHGLMPIETMVELAGNVSDPTQKWHSGISMVVPSTKILEIINQPKLIDYERAVEQAMKDNKPIETALGDETQKPKSKRKNRDVEIPPISRKKFFAGLTKASKRKP